MNFIFKNKSVCHYCDAFINKKELTTYFNCKCLFCVNCIDNFEYIIKLHTKSINNEYNDLTNFILSNNLSTLKEKLNKNICNCLGPEDYYISCNIYHIRYIVHDTLTILHTRWCLL